MSVWAKVGRKAIRFMNGVVDLAVLIVVLLLVAVGCYAIWDSKQVFNRADAAQYQIYRPTVENGGKTFEELRAINPDVFAWLTVYGTRIDYPVVQGPDNMTYVNTNAEGQYSLSGAIFLDYHCSRDFSDFSSIFYGHHMEKSAMFGDIGRFAEESYFRERPYGMLYYDGLEHGLEFFAFIHADAYDGAVFRTGITEPEQRQAYLDLLLDMAMHTRETGVTINDRIVLLSTCSGSTTNGRDILVGRITEGLYDNPFALGEPDGPGPTPVVDGLLPSLWARISLPGKVSIVFQQFFLILLLLAIRKKRKHKRKQRDSYRGGNEA